MTGVFFGAQAIGTTVRMSAIAAVSITGLTLAGCGTSGSNLLDSLGTAASPPPVASGPSNSKATKKKVAFAPLIGAPANISKQLSASVTSAVQKQNVPVVTAAGAPSDYTVRGYVVAAPDKSGTKRSYSGDVTDASSGKRAHRITGEECVKGKPGADPWANVSPAVIDGIANKTATQLATWVPSATPAGTSGVGGGQIATSAPAGSAAPAPAVTGAAKPAVQAAAVQTAGGPLPVLAMVPPVTGAPGDGQRALAEALKRNLSSRGIPLTTKASLQTYTVKGNVALGKPADGKQDIKIEWLVLDPKGQRVGTVAQKNKIPKGSLDGKWGKTADAAATAAAQGVAKLLPKTIKVN
ncbi:MAG: hypothetical protein ACR2O4_08900 [Hyphomicrobiaceae bacterium]